MAQGSTVTRPAGALAAALLAVAVLAPGLARGEDDTDTEIAKRHFAAGSAAYGAGDYRRALREFEEARLARPMAAFDYNIARCLDRLERYDEAIAAYEKYARSTPKATEAAEVQERIRVLRARSEARRALDARRQPPPKPRLEPASAERPSPAAEIAAPAVRQPRRRDDPRDDGAPPLYKKWWLWTVLGVAVVGAGVGLGVGLSRSSPAAPGCPECEFGTLRF